MPSGLTTELPLADVAAVLSGAGALLRVIIIFSIIVFFHELGHFLAARWARVRVDRFAIGFGMRLFGWRKGEGFTLGRRPEPKPDELAERGWGETDYCVNLIPLGGYVRMLGQDDIVIDDRTNELIKTKDPRAFINRPVGHRMVVASGGVVFNLLLAAILLMFVFLIGKPVEAPVIGIVEPSSPAAGKLYPGDRVLSVSGRRVYEFRDIQLAAAFNDSPLQFVVQRGGERLADPIPIASERDERLGLHLVPGLTPMLTSECLADGLPIEGKPTTRKGDVIRAVEGRPISGLIDYMEALQDSDGRLLRLQAERRDPKRPNDPPQIVECYTQAILRLRSADADPASPKVDPASEHLLGFVPRRAVLAVMPGMPAEKAGFLAGDVIAVWGSIPNPTYREIVDSIRASPGKPIDVRVLRGGRSIDLTVTPSQPSAWTGGDPVVGVGFALFDQNALVVADIAPGSPAAQLGIPRGATILAVDEKPVTTWFEFARELFGAAGKTVALRYRTGGDEVRVPFRVPSSLYNELGLRNSALIVSLNGQERLTVNGATVAVAGSTASVRAWLEEHVGQTVRIGYKTSLMAPVQTADFTVRQDNVDPWQGRVAFTTDGAGLKVLMETIDAGGNPLVALRMGGESLIDLLEQMYIFMAGLVTQRIGTQTVAGPIGIVHMTVEQPAMGLADLLFFTAIISINLAVFNFLPIPVLDGGLMLFLIIEKIKGKPLSLNTQIASTLIGLATIILAGLFFAFQDISRLMS